MPNLDSFAPHEFKLFAGWVDSDSVTAIPAGCAATVRNCEFHEQSARTRSGIQAQWGAKTGAQQPITGLASLVNVANQNQQTLVYDQAGNAYVENPAGSGVLKPLSPSAALTLQPGSIQAAQAFIGAYIAQTNLKNSTGQPAVYNLATGILDPLSMKPVGVPWAPNTNYIVGECVAPILPSAGGNGKAAGRLFRCTIAGNSGVGAVEPTWPNTDGGVIVSGTATFTENTPILGNVISTFAAVVKASGDQFANGGFPNSGIVATASVNPGVGAYVANRDIYVALTLVTGNGETSTISTIVVTNTNANDQLQLKITTALRQWILNLGSPATVTGWNAYVADVATGTPPPNSLTLYGKVPGGPFSVALNTILLVNSSPAAGGATYDNSVSSSVGDPTQGITPVITVGKIITYPDGRKFIQGANGLLPAPSTGNVVPATDSAFLVNDVGSIATGVRYAIVLFVNRNGYISGYGGGFAVRCDNTIPNLQFLMVNIPTGPVNTAQRIVAFTTAGGSAAGPFFYIPSGDVSNGVRITSTVINDNVSTQAAFNFTDTYLQGATNITNNSRKIQLPNASDVQYLNSINRLAFQCDDIPDGFRFSLLGDPEGFYGDTSTLQVAQGNGEKAITIRDFHGTIVALKERSGHVVTPSIGDPSSYDVQRKWQGVGPAGPRAVDVSSRFMCFAHRWGVFIFQGDRPYRISDEINTRRAWKGINWAKQEQIAVHIDEAEKVIRIQVPWGNSVSNNKEFTINFARSHDPTQTEEFGLPFHMSLQGQLIASVFARKWGFNDIQANVCIRAERTLANPSPDLSPEMLFSQILYGSANADGFINAVTPGIYNDNGQGIDSVYETSAHEQALAMMQVGGVRADLTGSGDTHFQVLYMREKSPQDGGGVDANLPPREVDLPETFNAQRDGDIGYECALQSDDSTGIRPRLRIHNNRMPDAWFDISYAAIMANPVADPGVM